MERDLVKRFIKKDGSQRISFYRDEYAENPRYNTDEPLHCEDWSRDYSIMNKDERVTKSRSARGLLEYMLGNYGNYKKMIDFLKLNATASERVISDKLEYDKSRKQWVLYQWQGHWEELTWFDCKAYDIDLTDLLEWLANETIDYFVENCITDKVKIMSYGFGYNGEISFYDEVSCDSEGICWMEKGEFLKYSGCKEEYWNGKSLDEIEWLLDELKAWGDNDVYGFVVEDAVKIQGIKTYYNGEREDEPYIDTQWEESDSCWGFYGELDKMIPYMFEQTNLKQEEFEEENV